ncbi:MAG: ATP-binding protein [Proteobacteria bacterium]|nr:ATP-binding protein [Pseudomonadota bacterium]
MTVTFVINMTSCLLASVLAGATLARDPGVKANRLMAAILACAAWWSFCEVVWNQCVDPMQALWWIRISGLGWLWLGALSLHIAIEVHGDPNTRIRHAIPVAYAAAAGSVALYLGTPWCITSAVPTAWGYGYTFGPLFPLVYGTTATLPVVLVVLGHRFYPREASAGERVQWQLAFSGVAFTLIVGTVSDVLLPWLGIHGLRVGAVSMSFVGVALALSLRRYGYLMLAPSAFAREIFSALKDGVVLLGPGDRVLMANPAFARFTGATGTTQLRGRRVSDWLPERTAQPASKPRSATLVPDAGDPFPVEISSNELITHQGQALGTALVVQDQREISDLRRRLVTSGRLASVGELSAGIAGEIREPMTAARNSLLDLQGAWAQLVEIVRGNGLAEALEHRVAEGEELIEECEEGIERVTALLEDVQGFSRSGAVREAADANDLVCRSLRVALPRSQGGVRVEQELGELPAIACAPQELKQVFLNLFANALQAMQGSGTLRLRTRSTLTGVEIRIEDDGPGIPEADVDRIFDPFFTTKPVGEGIGLGLSISYHIVRDHGGDLRVESEPGRGTAFVVELPRMS